MSRRVPVLVMVLLTLVLARSPEAAIGPVVLVSRQVIAPSKLEVQVGALVTWRMIEGRSLQLDLDPHPNAHEVVEQYPGRVSALFRKAGVHWYTVAVGDDSAPPLRGVVIVRESPYPAEELPFCSRESTESICLEP